MEYYAVMSDKRGLEISVEELTEKSDSFLYYQAKKHVKSSDSVYNLNDYYTLWGSKENAENHAKMIKGNWCSDAKSVYDNYCNVTIKSI